MNKTKLQNMSIKQKLTAIIMLASTVMLFLGITVFVVWGQIDARKQLVSDLRNYAGVIGDNTKAALAFSDKKDAVETLSAVKAKDSIIFACIYDKQGDIFVRYERSNTSEKIQSLHPPKEDFSFENGHLSVIRQIELDGERVGIVCLLDDMSEIHSRLVRDATVAVGTLVSVLAIAYLVSSRLQKLISGPILSLAEVVRTVSEKKDYSTRASKQNNDEIGSFIDAFNEMLDQIQKRDSALVEARDHLETRVNERTEELTNANKRLKLEVAERKRAQETIQEWKNRYEAAVLASGNILYDWDSRTNQVTYGGDLGGILGYTLEEMQGGLKRWMELIHPEDQSYFKNTIEHLIITKEPAHLEFRMRKKNGEYIFVEDTGRFITNYRGETIRMLGFVKDIAERKRAEDRLKHEKERADMMAREALSASEAKSQFLANMSHEIRTPMNAIIGFSDILAGENLAVEQKQYVDTIRDSGQHLLQIINDILDFSKIEAGKLDTEIVECSLAVLLNSIESLMRPTAREKNLDFKVIESEGLPSQILTDHARLRQCLINLINNAIKFTANGHVYLRVSLKEIDKEAFICFDVEDTGIGISEMQQQCVFDLFTQIDGTASRQYGGTGLGLAITRKLVELLNGKLSVRSEQGKGSTFSITIPVGVDVTKQPFLDRYKVAEHIESDTEKKELPMFSGHVLIAEDVKTNQMLTKSLLNRVGLEVTIAEDGNQAVQKALVREYDLIFMDIQMPNMNGYEATRVLRERGITTPIIALTANAMKGDDKKCTDAGCDDYLPKPLDRERLFDKIKKHLVLNEKSMGGNTNPSESQADELTKSCSIGTSESSQSGEPTNMDERILDWDKLMNIVGDEDLVREIVSVFVNENRERLDKLTTEIKASDTEAIRFYAHAIKGACRNIGAIRIFNIAQSLESAGRTKDFEAAIPLFNELKYELERVLSLLSSSNWIEIAKQEKVITSERLEAYLACRE